MFIPCGFRGALGAPRLRAETPLPTRFTCIKERDARVAASLPQAVSCAGAGGSTRAVARWEVQGQAFAVGAEPAGLSNVLWWM